MSETSAYEIAHEFVREFQECKRRSHDGAAAFRDLWIGCHQPVGDNLSGTGGATLQHEKRHRTNCLKARR